MPGGPDDTELIRRVAEGDAGALRTLVDRHLPAVWRVVRARTADAQTAEDVVQETVLGAWRGASAFRGETSARGWLLSIARRQAARTWRRRVGEPPRSESLEQLGPRAGWGGPDPERAAIRAEDRARLLVALASLSADDQEIIALRDLDGHSGPEAAAMLGVSIAAQKSRLHRARLRLMAALRGPEEGSSGR